MRDVTLVLLNSLRIKCHIMRPLKHKGYSHKIKITKCIFFIEQF